MCQIWLIPNRPILLHSIIKKQTGSSILVTLYILYSIQVGKPFSWSADWATKMSSFFGGYSFRPQRLTLGTETMRVCLFIPISKKGVWHWDWRITNQIQVRHTTIIARQNQAVFISSLSNTGALSRPLLSAHRVFFNVQVQLQHCKMVAV